MSIGLWSDVIMSITNHIIEIKRLTIINIVDNETDPLSSPCCCMKPTPNTFSKTPDDRPCTYTQELMATVQDKKALDFNYMCHAAHGLSLLLIAEYDETNVKTLRYGHLMIMADQDHDGSHIKGLIINFLHFFWPSLLEIPGFLKCFITPIVKCTNKRKKKDVTTFFNIPQYENWREIQGTNVKNYNIKYYKVSTKNLIVHSILKRR